MYLARFCLVTIAALGLACSDEGAFRLGALGQIEVTPGTVEFIIERVAVSASEVQVVAVRNLGEAELRIEDARIEVLDALGESPVVVSLRAAPPLFVAPDGASSQALTLTYTRVDARPRRLALVIQSSDARRRLVTVPIDVRRGAANLVAIPAQAAFAQGVALPALQPLRLVNAGSAPLSLGRMELDADAAFEVQLAGQIVGGNSGAFAATFEPAAIVPAGGELSLLVRFLPDDAQPVLGNLVLFGDSANTASGFPIPLIGNQNGPCILVRPGLMAFGEKAPGSISDIAAEIENCGAVPLEVTEVALATATHAADPVLVASGVTTSSARLSLLLPNAPSEAAPWRLQPAEVQSLTVRYSAWSVADVEAGAVPAADDGFLVVRSKSALPTRALPILASTERQLATDIPGCEWTGGEVVKHQVEIQMTADDAYEVWVDGASLARDTGVWRDIDTYAFELDSGCHVLGVHAWDTAAVRSGLIALVKIDGVVRWTSGDAKPEWSVSGPDTPAGDWHELLFDDSAWTAPRACGSTSIWGTAVAALEGQGARWVWWNTDCNDLSNAWFRLTFTVD